MNVTEILNGGYCGTIDRFSDRTGVVLAHEFCAVGRVFLECAAGFSRACINQPHEMLALTMLSFGLMFIMSLIMIPLFVMLLSEFALLWGFIPHGARRTQSEDTEHDDDESAEVPEEDAPADEPDDAPNDDAHSYNNASSDAEDVMRELDPDAGEWESYEHNDAASDGDEALVE